MSETRKARSLLISPEKNPDEEPMFAKIKSVWKKPLKLKLWKESLNVRLKTKYMKA